MDRVARLFRMAPLRSRLRDDDADGLRRSVRRPGQGRPPEKSWITPFSMVRTTNCGVVTAEACERLRFHGLARRGLGLAQADRRGNPVRPRLLALARRGADGRWAGRGGPGKCFLEYALIFFPASRFSAFSGA